MADKSLIKKDSFTQDSRGEVWTSRDILEEINARFSGRCSMARRCGSHAVSYQEVDGSHIYNLHPSYDSSRYDSVKENPEQHR